MTSSCRVFHDYKSLPCPKKRLLRTAGKIERGENTGIKRVVNVVLCSDYKIRKLNLAYLGKDCATDVIAFPFKDKDLRGELYISLQRAKAQASRFGLTYESEVARLRVDGFLHRLGYDHGTTRERLKMESREARYCCLSKSGSA